MFVLNSWNKGERTVNFFAGCDTLGTRAGHYYTLKDALWQILKKKADKLLAGFGTLGLRTGCL